MNAHSFKLTLELATPFHIRHPITLDALLSAAVFKMNGKMGTDTIQEIPLLREENIFHGSSVHYSKTYRNSSFGRVMSLKTESDLSSSLFAPNKKRGSGYGYIDQQRGQYKANIESYPSIEAREVFFWGVGDAEACASLIQRYIPGLGKRASSGAGEIIRVFVDDSDDHSWVTKSDTPARPLPVSLWKKISANECPITPMPMAVDIPYWDTPHVDAVFPKMLTI